MGDHRRNFFESPFRGMGDTGGAQQSWCGRHGQDQHATIQTTLKTLTALPARWIAGAGSAG
jgi:hypothetical protein